MNNTDSHQFNPTLQKIIIYLTCFNRYIFILLSIMVVIFYYGNIARFEHFIITDCQIFAV